jgi:hypothetical protein
VARGEHIIPHKPKRVICKASAYDITPVLFYKLTEIIGIDNMCVNTGSREGARPKPAKVDPFLDFVRAGV